MAETVAAQRSSISEEISKKKLAAAEAALADRLKEVENDAQSLVKDARLVAMSESEVRLKEAVDAAVEEAVAATKERYEHTLAQQAHEQEMLQAALDDTATGAASSSHLSSDQSGVPPVLHPALGRPLVDLGYKQIYLVHGNALANMPVWEKQRIYRHERAEVIARDILKKGFKGGANGDLNGSNGSMNGIASGTTSGTSGSGLPGVITLLQSPTGLKVLDGQHRVGALAVIGHAMKNDPESVPDCIDISRILVEVFIDDAYYEAAGARPVDANAAATSASGTSGSSTSGISGTTTVDTTTTDAPVPSSSYAKELFNVINSAVPVKYIDTPDVATAVEKDPINDATEALMSRYPKMFKVSHRCKIPHLHVDTLRNDLFEANVMRSFKLSSSEDLLGFLVKQNDKMSSRVLGRGKNRIEVSDAVKKKCADNGLFLGVDKSWMFKQ
jgi:hypothetical protein